MESLWKMPVSAFDDEPGRPRKVIGRRSARVQRRVDEFQERAASFVEADPLFLAATSSAALESLYTVREELAREAAGLLFTRLQAIPGSREMARLATRRINALRAVASLTLAIARVDAGAPSPERLRRILQSLADVVDDAAAHVLPEPAVAEFKTSWRARLEPFLAGLDLPTVDPLA